MASKSIEFNAVVNANQINRLLADLRTDAEGAARAINQALGGRVTKKIVLQEEIDNRGARRLVAVDKERLSVTDQIISRQKALDSIQRGSVTSLRQQLNEAKKSRDGVRRYANTIDGINSTLGSQRTQWTQLNNRVSQLARELAVAEASGFWQQLKVATR